MKRFFTLFGCAYLGSLSSLSLIILLFWPGKFSEDSFIQLEQALGLVKYSNSHPVTMALIMSGFSNILPGHFLYLIFHAFWISLMSALSISVFLSDIKLGRRFEWLACALISCVLVILPPGGLFNIIIWKDIPFTWSSLLLVVLVTKLWSSADKAESRLNIFWLCFGIGLLAGTVMHFRHNAFTISYTALALSTLRLVLSKYKAYWRSYLSLFGAFFVLIFIRYELKNRFILSEADRDVIDRFDVSTWVARNDFLQTLKLGIELTPEETSKLNSLIDVPKTLSRVSLDNSFYSLSPTYRGSPDIVEPQFIDFSRTMLMKYPLSWAKTKIIYTANVVTSVKGYQRPLFYEEPVNDPRVSSYVDLNMNPALAKYRAAWLSLMKMEHFGLPGRALIWTFWPLVFGFSVLFFLKLRRFQKDRQLNFASSASLVPLVISCAHSFGPLLVSLTNDFRYFWPCQLFFLVSFFTEWSYRKISCNVMI